MPAATGKTQRLDQGATVATLDDDGNTQMLGGADFAALSAQRNAQAMEMHDPSGDVDGLIATTGGTAALNEIDLDDIPEPQPFTGTWHSAVIRGAKPSTSKNGNPVITLQWAIDAEDPNGHSGENVWEAVTFTAKTKGRVKMLLSALGMPTSGKITAESFVGEHADIFVKTEQSTGVDSQGEPYPDRPRVQKHAPYGTDHDTSNLFG